MGFLHSEAKSVCYNVSVSQIFFIQRVQPKTRTPPPDPPQYSLLHCVFKSKAFRVSSTHTHTEGNCTTAVYTLHTVACTRFGISQTCYQDVIKISAGLGAVQLESVFNFIEFYITQCSVHECGLVDQELNVLG